MIEIDCLTRLGQQCQLRPGYQGESVCLFCILNLHVMSVRHGFAFETLLVSVHESLTKYCVSHVSAIGLAKQLFRMTRSVTLASHDASGGARLVR